MLRATDLVGSWRLVSCEHRRAGGAVERPIGLRPEGRLIYSGDGRISVVLVDPARKKFRSAQLFEAAEDEWAIA